MLDEYIKRAVDRFKEEIDLTIIDSLTDEQFTEHVNKMDTELDAWILIQEKQVTRAIRRLEELYWQRDSKNIKPEMTATEAINRAKGLQQNYEK